MKVCLLTLLDATGTGIIRHSRLDLVSYRSVLSFVAMQTTMLLSRVRSSRRLKNRSKECHRSESAVSACTKYTLVQPGASTSSSIEVPCTGNLRESA